MATITRYPTASGDRWEVRYRTPEGRTTRKRGFTTKRDAAAYGASTEVSKSVGSYVAPSAGRVTVATLAARWESGLATLAPTTRASNLSAYRQHVGPRWGQTPVGKVTTSGVRSWAAELASSDLGAASVSRALFVLRQILALAVDDGHAARNVAEGVKVRRPDHRARRYLSHEHVEALATAAGTSGTLVRFLAYTGLRFGEAAALTVADVDFLRRRVLVEKALTEVSGKSVESTPKTHHRRSVPFPSFLTEELAVLCEGKERTARLFTASSGGDVRLTNWRRRVFTPAATACHGEDVTFPAGITPHDLRHTAASLAISAGANVKAVQTMLGHASAAMTLDTYADLFPDDLEAVSAALDTARASALGNCVQSVSTDERKAASE